MNQVIKSLFRQTCGLHFCCSALKYDNAKMQKNYYRVERRWDCAQRPECDDRGGPCSSYDRLDEAYDQTMDDYAEKNHYYQDLLLLYHYFVYYHYLYHRYLFRYHLLYHNQLDFLLHHCQLPLYHLIICKIKGKQKISNINSLD